MRALCIPLIAFFFIIAACNKGAKPPHFNGDSTVLNYGEDTVRFSPDTTKFFAIDTTGLGKLYDTYDRVKNLLHFHTRDTMRTDSTYVATLYMGKNITAAELDKKVSEIVEQGGKVKVEDTTQEISMYMTATLEDKASENDRNFDIAIVGGTSNLRKYDEKKNKMVWQWNVTPRKTGNHDLILSISHVDADSHEMGSPETHRHSITIFASKHPESVGKGLGNFFGKHWQWLVGAIVLPVFLAWFTTRRKNAVAKKSGNPPAVNENWKRKKKRY